MKLLNKVIFFLVVLAIVCATAFAEEEGPKRNSILRRPSARGAPKTTTTTAAPSEAEEEVGDEEYDQAEYENVGDQEGADASSTTTTSTEAPKKIGPIIRPFRTNDDFLNSLKRRQQNAKKALKEKPTPKVTKVEEPNEDGDEESEPARAPVSQSKFKSNSPLSRRKLSKPTRSEPTEEVEQPQEEAAPAPSPIGRRPGRLSLKPRN